MKLTNENVIRSVSDNQHQILKWIIELYVPEGRFDYDPTYSKGVFYKTDVPEPRFKSCLTAEGEVDFFADAQALPIKSGSLNSICFDPPFVGGSRKDGKPGIIKTRFSYYKNIPMLWGMYTFALAEFYRTLKDGGVLVFKCQDSVESSKQYLTSFVVIRLALAFGFYPRDQFILTAKTRILRSEQKQQHARKFHSYFLVFIKEKPKVVYP